MKTKLTALMVGLALVGSVQAAKHNVEIEFSKGISKKQRKTMSRDLKVLEEMDFHLDADEETLKVMGLDRLDAQSAKTWLEDRVRYVIEDTAWEKVEKGIKVEQQFYSYDNASIDPIIERATSKPTGKGVTVMSNLGAALYYAGKSSKVLLSYPVKTGTFKKKSVKFSSPRAGLIMVGEGHFMQKFDHDQNDRKATANSYGRLSTFFHEARHSDGGGKHLGFFHAVCPDGHDFQGYTACDRNLNGPYAVGAKMTKEFLKNCDDCDDEVQEKMKVSYLSSLNRIIKETKKPAQTSDAEASGLQMQLEIQQMMLGFLKGPERDEALEEISKLKAQILAIAEREGTIETIPSEYVDASPEGERLD